MFPRVVPGLRRPQVMPYLRPFHKPPGHICIISGNAYSCAGGRRSARENVAVFARQGRRWGRERPSMRGPFASILEPECVQFGSVSARREQRGSVHRTALAIDAETLALAPCRHMGDVN